MQNYFTPLNNIMYLVIIIVALIGYFQYKWAKICRNYVQVLVVKSDGHGTYELSPQSGGSVTLKSPTNNSTRLWPINKLATIDVPYPGNGAVPAFLQKTIRMVVVDEEDWEPILNRGPYKERVASPDVIKYIRELAESCKNEEIASKINAFADDLKAAPTREMIASPAVLGNLTHEKITEAVLTVNKDVVESISGIIRRLGKMVSPTMFFVGVGALLVILVFIAWQAMPVFTKLGNLAGDVELIKTSLGIITPRAP